MENEETACEVEFAMGLGADMSPERRVITLRRYLQTMDARTNWDGINPGIVRMHVMRLLYEIEK